LLALLWCRLSGVVDMRWLGGELIAAGQLSACALRDVSALLPMAETISRSNMSPLWGTGPLATGVPAAILTPAVRYLALSAPCSHRLTSCLTEYRAKSSSTTSVSHGSRCSPVAAIFPCSPLFGAPGPPAPLPSPLIPTALHTQKLLGPSRGGPELTASGFQFTPYCVWSGQLAGRDSQFLGCEVLAHPAAGFRVEAERDGRRRSAAPPDGAPFRSCSNCTPVVKPVRIIHAGLQHRCERARAQHLTEGPAQDPGREPRADQSANWRFPHPREHQAR